MGLWVTLCLGVVPFFFMKWHPYIPLHFIEMIFPLVIILTITNSLSHFWGFPLTLNFPLFSSIPNECAYPDVVIRTSENLIIWLQKCNTEEMSLDSLFFSIIIYTATIWRKPSRPKCPLLYCASCCYRGSFIAKHESLLNYLIRSSNV